MARNILLLGSPGDGKSTTAAALARALQDKSSKPAQSVPASGAPSTFSVSTGGSECVLWDYVLRHPAVIKTKFTAAILVVSAVEEVRADVEGQIAQARKLGIERVVVLVNKFDLLGAGDREMVGYTEEAVGELLDAGGFKGAAVNFVRGSALRALEGKAEDVEGLKRLLEGL